MALRTFYASSYNMGQHFGPESNAFFNQLAEALSDEFDLVRASDAFKEYGKFKGFTQWLLSPPAGEEAPRFGAFVVPVESEITRYMLEEDDTRVLLEAYRKIHTYVPESPEGRYLCVHKTTGEMVMQAGNMGLPVKIAGPGFDKYFDIKDTQESTYLTDAGRTLTTYCLYF